MSKEGNSKNSEKDEQEESELEEKVEDSEDENSKENESEGKNKKTKKPVTIIPESVWNESRRTSFLNFLNQNSSVTLDKRGTPFNEIAKNLELTLEGEEATPTISNGNKNENQKTENENPFEYIPKSPEENQQGFYQHSENTSATKLIRQDELRNLRKPFQQEAGRIEYEPNRGPKLEEEYKINVRTQRVEDLQKEKKEKGIFLTEAKREYYSHDH